MRVWVNSLWRLISVMQHSALRLCLKDDTLTGASYSINRDGTGHLEIHCYTVL
jgi:hypothetical protein